MGGDDPSFFSSPPMPTPGGGAEEQFVPSKRGYLHIKNQVQNYYFYIQNNVQNSNKKP